MDDQNKFDQPENQQEESQQQEEQQEQTEQPVSIEENRDARHWAFASHLAGLAWFIPFPAANVILPLIFWQIKKHDFEFVDDQGREAVNFQLTMLLIGIIGALFLPIFCVGAFILVAVTIVNLVLVILAAVAAGEGKKYRYPISIRFIK